MDFSEPPPSYREFLLLECKCILLFTEPWAAAKKLYARVAVPPAPVQVPSQRIIAPSVTSVANDKDDNEMIPRAMHRSPGI